MVEGNVGIGSGQDVVAGVACHCAPPSQAGGVTEGSPVGDTGAGQAVGTDCAKFSQRRFINGDVGCQSSIARSFRSVVGMLGDERRYPANAMTIVQPGFGARTAHLSENFYKDRGRA
jgi:hypothetical protein